MHQTERLLWLVDFLAKERGQTVTLPTEPEAQFRLFRALQNTREPLPVPEAFLRVQDAFLQEEIAARGIVTLPPAPITLWRGDITTLAVDGIVNAANSALLGCFAPCHGCIDNQIHTFAGVQLRLSCWEMMRKQGFDEPTGQAKITPAFNLPSAYVLHTVGPIVRGAVTDRDCAQLASCYTACLNLAKANDLHSLAFCCISTGEFGFPQVPAAHIAVDSVQAWQAQNGQAISVIFNVFKESDDDIYRRLLVRVKQSSGYLPSPRRNKANV